VQAPSFEAAEKTLSLAVEEALGTIKKAGGEGRKLGWNGWWDDAQTV